MEARAHPPKLQLSFVRSAGVPPHGIMGTGNGFRTAARTVSSYKSGLAVGEPLLRWKTKILWIFALAKHRIKLGTGGQPRPSRLSVPSSAFPL